MFLPPDKASDALRNVDVEDDGKAQQEPQVAAPDHKHQGVEQSNHTKLNPLISKYMFCFLHNTLLL
jgi:hypothetical protein